MGVDSLPSTGDDDLIARLLTEKTFKSALGKIWRIDDHGVETCAPTTNASFHIVLAAYDGGFIDVDRVSCMRCHETVNHHVDRFNFGRDWYGRIRGSDGIFSFHPFASSSISYNGISRGVCLNHQLVNAGVVARFEQNKHPREIYHRVPQLRD